MVLLSFFWSPAFAADLQGGLKLNLLVYNTHGLPAYLAGDKPEERFPEIAKRTGTYDLALLQEDFAHHELLLSHLKKPVSVTRGEDPVVPPCMFCSGSGLTLISNLEDLGWTIETTFHAFDVCSGWLSGANDCFAQKGFQLITMATADGRHIVLVNTHLDAGRSDEDRQARAVQLNHIATVLEREAGGAALIVAGDLNLRWDIPGDNALLMSFRDRLGLRRAEQGAAADQGWAILDYIYFRSGKTVTLNVAASGEDTAFANKMGPLSDHPALFATFLAQ